MVAPSFHLCRVKSTSCNLLKVVQGIAQYTQPCSSTGSGPSEQAEVPIGFTLNMKKRISRCKDFVQALYNDNGA